MRGACRGDSQNQAVVHATHAGCLVSRHRLLAWPTLIYRETTSHYLAAALVLALDLVFYGISTLNSEQVLERKSQVDYLVGAVKTTETFEGNAGRIVGQVETLLSLAVSLVNDIQPLTLVETGIQRVGIPDLPGLSFDDGNGDGVALSLDDATSKEEQPPVRLHANSKLPGSILFSKTWYLQRTFRPTLHAWTIWRHSNLYLRLIGFDSC